MLRICTLLCLLFSSGLFAQSEDCRVKFNDLQPIISPFNPFFIDHQWKADQKIETARIDNHRLLMITQSGCKRHHASFLYILRPGIIIPTDSFWIAETKNMLRAVYFDNEDYPLYREDFEQKFIEKLRMYGLNENFNFPIGTRNFICQVRHDPGQGANIRIESVRYIFAETIQRKGIPRDQDDGWFQQTAN